MPNTSVNRTRYGRPVTSNVRRHNTRLANMPQPVPYVRVYADQSGHTHLERSAIALETRTFAPPAPELDVSAEQQASAFAILRLPIGWWGEWHPSPYRQWLFFLSGSAVIHTSDGSECDVGAGSVVLLEDTSGMGHQTRVTGKDEVVIASVRQREASVRHDA
jgi:hypothetical protein